MNVLLVLALVVPLAVGFRHTEPNRSREIGYAGVRSMSMNQGRGKKAGDWIAENKRANFDYDWNEKIICGKQIFNLT